MGNLCGKESPASSPSHSENNLAPIDGRPVVVSRQPNRFQQSSRNQTNAQNRSTKTASSPSQSENYLAHIDGRPVVVSRQPNRVQQSSRNLANAQNRSTKTVLALKHVRTRSQLSDASTEYQQFTLSMETVEACGSKIEYLVVKNRSTICKIAKIYYMVSSANGNQKQCECKFDLGLYKLTVGLGENMFLINLLFQPEAKQKRCRCPTFLKWTTMRPSCWPSISYAMANY
jgi:hypothetical protein